jgi:hypothetical protein
MDARFDRSDPASLNSARNAISATQEAAVDDTSRKREDDWFLKNEEQMIEAARIAREKREKERAAREQAAELERVKALHFMKCPKCGHDLREEPIGDVTVDRCSFCEGVFLDCGELERVFLKREDDRKGFLKRVLGL